MTLRHRCGAVVDHNDFLAGLCTNCGFLIEEAPPLTGVYVCTNGHVLHSVQPPERWLGRVCGARTVRREALGRPYTADDIIGPCDGIWQLADQS